ncbi:hypothetical protein BGK60_09945 [Tannerella forsythia]|nr:hypothetical protein BGK60_09945 [Tannerella forsythia]
MFFCFFKVYTCFLRSGYFFYAVPPVRFARRFDLSGGVSAVISIVLYFFVMYDKGINIFLIRCKYFVCFFASFASFFANLAVRSPQGTQKLHKARKFV